MDQLASAYLLRQYQDAGKGFDGIHQMLLPHLRENRHTEPRPADFRRLASDIGLLGIADYFGPDRYSPNFVIDESVLLSYARLDNETVGAALVDAAHDSACQIIVSPLAYLWIAPALRGTEGEQRAYRFRTLGGDVRELTIRQVEIMSRLDTGERADIVHTALLGLQYRCVIGTLNPGAYHRLGYLRTVNLSA